ncbi:conserved Plasmodium protein, unknown function [Plasmodium sp. gorilla clade G2]|uniref:conserved Plasmodium protein, unknown function n=1 Tax=Plasmodium sp. gorilla clade G2 TaxID=880535 RepID=UPI000D21C28D|nr:conserved Plasmodium protein, unknown function [Plasmodium sp. gorilla clade G2]SOV14480.1 conserved Plasmodium protein, unknown function [Plasmodium sp. gorilla clade G2]
MTKPYNLNTSSYDISNDYNSLYIENIFNEIQNEINNTCASNQIVEEKEGKHISSNNKNEYNNKNNIKKNYSSTNSLYKYIGHINNKIINIDEYVNFINNKKNEYKKKKKEYIIEYINKNKIKKLHYKDMIMLFEKYAEILEFKQKCLLCNNYLSFSYLYLTKFLKKLKQKDTNNDVYDYKYNITCSDKYDKYNDPNKKYIKYENDKNSKHIHNNKEKNCLFSFCECIEKIHYSETYISNEKDSYYIDMIDYIKKNTSFSTCNKKNMVIKGFFKNVKFTKFYNFFNEKYGKTFLIKKNYNTHTKHINMSNYFEKPILTIEHVKELNSHTENFIPFFKINHVNTLLTTVEKKILIECLKVTNKIIFHDKIDKLTVIIFCYLSNLHNIVMRLNAECIMCCYSKKHFEFFLHYFIQKSNNTVKRMKTLAVNFYTNEDDNNNKVEDNNI